MLKKLGKKARLLIMMISILGLMGCGSLNKIQANQIEEKLSEMYGGEFEVLALGNRFGTLTNDTVTARVKSKDLDMLFDTKMNTKGEIVADNFYARYIGTNISNILTKNIKAEGIKGESYIKVFGGKDLKTFTLDTTISEYITNYSPEYFAGFLIIKNDTNNSARQIINAFTKTYQEYLNTTFQATIFVLNEEEYEQCIKKLAEQTNINTDTFSEFDIVSEFRLSVTSDGLSKSENEVNKLLQGGE
ncbi:MULTISPECIES: hypothetical protein [Bacillaceae]|jgi:hypothetical protein|uniref:hypothetical protein n=1 Tax=Bacillaceae TaxID=186817 RepID=UPI00203FB8C6|nr:hypothetical protein [Caldibacillus thermoamylovorans]MCM3056487.1 hypothetical protein [Caldibacillus thermoamylovorans]MCM3476948.1 hypothetical protein [Caldibacillus thermoamylovorans]